MNENFNVILCNPRLEATFKDWPLGGGKRGECRFFVERNPKKGVRIGRVTTGKSKYTPYSGSAVICDGNDGKTYIVQHVTNYGFIKVWQSNLDTNQSFFRQDPMFESLYSLIKEV